MRTALVLSGGGNLGVVQIAFIEALFARGVRPDLIVGTSVGALNGALLAADPSPETPARMAEIWLGLQGRRLFHRNPLRIGRNMLSSRLSLYRNDFVRELVRDHLPATTFEDLSTPLSVTVTNLTRGGGRVFEHGPLLPSLLASTAIPGLFPPVEIDGEWYVDGGIATAIGLEAAIERGADLILAIDLNSRGAGWRPRRLHDVLMRSIQVASARRYDAILSLQSRRACVVIWRPGLVAHGGASSFRDTGFLLAQAREMAGGLIDLATAPLGGFYPGTYEGAVAVAA